jgi:hypothetical protein
VRFGSDGAPDPVGTGICLSGGPHGDDTAVLLVVDPFDVAAPDQPVDGRGGGSRTETGRHGELPGGLGALTGQDTQAAQVRPIESQLSRGGVVDTVRGVLERRNSAHHRDDQLFGRIIL